jgi:hypothetical protein
MVSLLENASDSIPPAPPETAGQAIERIAADLGLTMAAAFVPFSRSRNAKPGPFSRDGKPWRSLNWRVTLSRNGRPVLENVDYAQGEGHCPAYKLAKQSDSFWPRRFGQVQGDAIAAECETGLKHVISSGRIYPKGGRIAPPFLADVLHSLCRDASVIDHASFEDWAGELGYDPDSRAGEAAYRACLATGLALRAAIGDAGLERLREAAQDY